MIAFLLFALPELRLEWSISIGNLTVLTFMLGVVWKGLPIYRAALVILAEHNYVVKAVADAQGITRDELRTHAIMEGKDVKLKAKGAVSNG